MRRVLVAMAVCALSAAADAQTGPILHVSVDGTYVTLRWTAVPGATQYRVDRTASYPNWSQVWLGNALVTAQTVATNTAWVYQVVPLNAQGPVGPASNAALATTYSYADDPLIASQHKSRPAHILDLRAAINGARVAAGLGAVSWTNNIVSGGVIADQDILELRAALNAALSNIGLQHQAYVDDSGLNGLSIRSAHIAQLRVRARHFPQILSPSYSVSSPYSARTTTVRRIRPHWPRHWERGPIRGGRSMSAMPRTGLFAP